MEIGTVGWLHAGWDGSFYPETMPPEWRLTYYSNEFPCVLVSAEQAASADPDHWLGDTHGGFRFFLRISAQAPSWPGEDWARRLGERLGGVVWDGAPAAHRSGAALFETLAGLALPQWMDADARDDGGAAAGRVWRAGSARQGCTVGIVTQPFHGDRRALRACVATFLGQVPAGAGARLFFDGQPPELSSVRDAAVIAGLLGA